MTDIEGFLTIYFEVESLLDKTYRSAISIIDLTIDERN